MKATMKRFGSVVAVTPETGHSINVPAETFPEATDQWQDVQISRALYQALDCASDREIERVLTAERSYTSNLNASRVEFINRGE